MKIFKRKKESNVVKDPISYIKKERNHHFFFATSWRLPKVNLSEKGKKILRRSGLVALPVLAICLGTTLGIIANANQNKEDTINQVIVNKNQNVRRVYLISDDDYAVPLSINMAKKNNIHEEMLDVINLMKVSSKASNEYLHGFINDDAKVNSFTTDASDQLTVDFSKDFLRADGVDQNTKLDALVTSLLQFNNYKSVNITTDGEPFKNIAGEPKLNKIISTSPYVSDQELVTVFYQRQYDIDHKYLVPVSLYSQKGETDNITFVNGLFKTLPSKYLLKNLDIYEHIEKNQTANEEFNLLVNSKALIDETTVNKELYEIVLLSLNLMGKEEKVSFSIEGETLMVEGIYKEDDMAVDSILYNEIEI